VRPSTLLIASALLTLAGAAVAAPPDRGSTQERPTVRGAILSPLEDVNLKQSDIPDVLTRAVANPYEVKGLTRCEPIAGEIGRLDAALGPDLDEVAPPDTRTKTEKLAGKAKSAGVTVVRDESRSIVPFRGWVRKLTGAERHQKEIRAAIEAGRVRRGYLKGLGMNMNCAPPAAPSWFVPRLPTMAAAKKPEPSLVDKAIAWWPWELKK
jgi:hypothetical protein